MKKFYALITCSLAVLLLAGCGNYGSSKPKSNSGEKTSKVSTTGTSKSGQYNTLLQNGKYHVSSISGLTATGDSSNEYNPRAFAAGLSNVSKKKFSPDKYYFQEGKYISAATAQDWLGRKSKKNPDGLNPEDNGKKEENKRKPIYLQQMQENDYYTQNGDHYNLAGMTIGLAMNDVDYYTKEKYGTEYKTKISDSEREKVGREMANEIVHRLRQKNSLKSIPIVVGLYKQNVNDSLVGGNFFSYGASDSGNSVGNWNSIKEESQVLPTVNDESPINKSDSDSFSNFKNKIQNYFPNVSGVTAQTHYSDGELKGMSVTITTQFFGYDQINSFTQFVQDAANKYLPNQPAIEIKIQTVQQMQSLITKDYNNKQYNAHVMTAY